MNINVTALKSKEQLIELCKQAIAKDEDLCIQFFKNGWGLRIETEELYGEIATTEITVDKVDGYEGGAWASSKWFRAFPKEEDRCKHVQLLRSINYAYGWTYMLEQLDRFRQTGLREDYPNLTTVYECCQNRLSDPIV